MNKRITSTLLAVILLCSLTVFVQAAGPGGISLKDGGTELLSFDPNVYTYSVQPDTWTNSLTLSVDDEGAIVYSNAGTGVTGQRGLYTVSLAPLGSATGITVITGGKTYFINSKHKPISASAELTSFAFTKADNPQLARDIRGIIDGETQTITLDFPIPADGTLKASFAHSGVSVRVNGIDQASGVSEQDFTKDKKPTYYLVAADGLDAIYTVNARLRDENLVFTAESDLPLIEEIPGQIGLAVTGENLEGKELTAYLEVGGELLCETALIDGAGTMSVAKLPAAGAYDVLLYIDGEAAACAAVTVAPKATEVVINAPVSVTVKKGKTLQLDVDSNAALLVYASSNTGVATVSQTGLVTGVKTGMTIVTVYAADNSQKFAYVVVNVIA